MTQWIIGNWKMHGLPVMAAELARAVAGVAMGLPAAVKVVVCPPATLASAVSEQLKGSRVAVGGQDCHAQAQGAFTGDISAQMLKEAGAAYVIVGHSERRQYHGETDEGIRAKAQAAISGGLIPIICVGETLDERQSGQAEDVVGRQVRECLPDGAQNAEFLLAYEPVWAIGSGAVPSLLDIQGMHHHIQSVAAEKLGIDAGSAHVLYGGSVKGANAQDILATDGVAGALVGGASLKADEFGQIMLAAKG